MKRPDHSLKLATGLAVMMAAVAVFGAGGETPAAAPDGKTNNLDAGGFATNIPVAVFELNARVKDPFFPLSTRSPFPVQVVTNVAPAQLKADCFTLNGMSIGAEGAMVIINGHTFAEGESFEIAPLCGGTTKVKLTVTKIKQFSAMVRVDGFMDGLELMLPETAR